MSSSPQESFEADSFELEVTTFRPAPVSKIRRVKTVAELDRQLAHCKAEPMLVTGLTALDEDECGWGLFWLCLNGDRA